MTFGCETWSIQSGAMKRIKTIYNGFLAHMLRIKPMVEDDAASCVHRRNKIIKSLTQDKGEWVNQTIYRKIWGFIGHCLRHQGKRIKNVLLWRDWHRSSGAQVASTIDKVEKTLRTEGFENAIANDRCRWHNLMVSWLHYSELG